MADIPTAHNDMQTVPNCQKSLAIPVEEVDQSKQKMAYLLSHGKDKVARWAEHFCEVLNRPAPAIPAQVEDPGDTLPINTEKFTEERLERPSNPQEQQGIWHRWNQH